jgi:hypothetical protein
VPGGGAPGRLVTIVAAILVSGCERPGPAELATLEQISPTELEIGEQLRLRGSGFVAGTAVLELRGVLSAPGQATPSQETRMEVPVLATSPNAATARLSWRHFERSGSPHLTFTGRAILRFDSAAGPDAPPVLASLEPVRLEFFTGPSSHHSGALETHRRGQDLLEELGVTGTVLPESRGVLIEHLRSGSPGAQAGLRPGEVIVASGNVTAASIADLAPPPETHVVSLGVRDVDGRIRRVACSLRRRGVSPDSDRVAALALAGGALAFILVVAGPLRGPCRWLGAALARGGHGPLGFLAQLMDSGRSRPLGALLAVLLFACAPFAVMALAPFGVVLEVGLVVIASVAAATTAVTGGHRVLAAGTAVVRTLPLVMVAVVAAVRGASMSLEDIVAAQGAAPWDWNLLSDPACLLTLVVICAVTCAGDPGHPGPSAALLRGLSGALVTALLLGGWSLAAAPATATMTPSSIAASASAIEPSLWGQLVFALKAWVVGLWMVHGGRSGALAAAPLAALLVAATLALNLFPIPDWAPFALGWSAAALAAALVVPLALGQLRRHGPDADLRPRSVAADARRAPRPGPPDARLDPREGLLVPAPDHT